MTIRVQPADQPAIVLLDQPSIGIRADAQYAIAIRAIEKQGLLQKKGRGFAHRRHVAPG
jgi:hypothetical protein